MHLLFAFIFLFSFQQFGWATTQSDSKINIKAMGRVRGEVSNNKDFSNATEDKNNFIGSRFRLSIDIQPNTKTSIFTELQYSKTWGNPSAILQNDPASIHQAYIQRSAGENFIFKIGRQELNYGDELIIGAVGWSNVGRSFDAFKTRFVHNLGWSDLFIADVTKTNGASTTNDHYFSGFYNHFSFALIDEVELYYLHSQDPSATVNSVSHFGSRVKSKISSFDYRAEVTGQSDISAHQWDVEAGYLMNATRISLEAFSASRDYIQLYPTAHKWLGIGDFITRRNISGARFGVNHKFCDCLTASLDYHMFQRTDDTAPYYSFGGTALTAAGTDKNIGNELDLSINFKVDETYSLSIVGAHFFAGRHLKENNMNDDGDFYYLQTKAVF